MATHLAYSGTLPGAQLKETEAYYAARNPMSRPVSHATIMEELDSENDEDDDLSYLDESPFTSVASFGTGSTSSASTSDEVTTPDSTGLTAFDFHIDEKHVRGPSGPHLFRSSMDLSEYSSFVGTDATFEDPPPSAMAAFYQSASKLDPFRMDTPVPNRIAIAPQPQAPPQPQPRHRPQQLQLDPQIHPAAYSQTCEAPGLKTPSLTASCLTAPSLTTPGLQTPGLKEVWQWCPGDVVRWLHDQGFDGTITEMFYVNDINGSILLELQTEDLKELGIQSFGKRRMLMNAIKTLQESPHTTTMNVPLPSEISSVPPTPRTGFTVSSSDCPSNPNPDGYGSDASSGLAQDQHHLGSRSRVPGDMLPGDSVSIVAIEEVLPKLHSCSKGENCRKWQKQQAKLAQLAQDLPIGNVNGRIILTGDPGNPKTAPNLIKTPKVDQTPSLVASSDVLGPLQTPRSLGLSKEKLNEVQPRDPQENVRNFLSFQHLSNIQSINDPATPPQESARSPESSSPMSPKGNPTLSENLRHLPRLMIPGTDDLDDDDDETYTNLSAQRTVTQEYPTAIPRGQQRYAYGTAESPADFYRDDPHYSQYTPYSEVDVPVTAFPIGLIAREDSQSVPPNMRFGSDRLNLADPIHRPSSTKAMRPRRNTSHQNTPNLKSLDERRAVNPIDTPEDLAQAQRMGHGSPTRRSPNDVTHSGWMKKRKTTRLLRHEWEENHYTLKGTQLAKHADEASAQRHSRALEYIDVDDYAVACSSLASSSKLTAAFKKTVLKRRNNGGNESAFAFSLIPATGSSNTIVDKKALFLNPGKSHHFAVNTRDERIDWMRELMLAKALKRGRENGFDMSNNFI
ncbi:SAM and PH domain-containing protein [Aspergillus homomorphus CBS 101889]|uniref:SAM and PH domain protein n=1 Tax=Aspergillus homomorphus (strain CBS 101889) TaxID=1450537 RepID=A0A395HVF4_ASPHC|nr:hypothetical protein BO97DRAFT_435377 [Aspergillus homomorphus CBS 101889]RAL11393.1 hypothetical protein BO97DRAFT_435377 [Aspergillus homomorphus CBS 101889]